MGKAIAKARVEAAIRELKKVQSAWLRRPGVTALDVGYRMKDGRLTDELAIRVHVARKLPPAALATGEAFSTTELPGKLGEFAVDVIEAQYGPGGGTGASLASPPGPVGAGPVAQDAVSRTTRVDPLIGGISVGSIRANAGTLGAIVWDTTDGERCILSNWHILCKSADCGTEDRIYQPGFGDGGRAPDTVAMLKRVRLDKTMDAALARLTGVRPDSRDLLGLEPISGMAEAALGMEVVKSGRTTGVTRGMIDGLSGVMTLNYGRDFATGQDRVQTFEGQIHIVPRAEDWSTNYELSMAGDSGAVWIEAASGRAIGLHLAGEPDNTPSNEFAFANPIKPVAEALQFAFAPVFRSPAVGEDSSGEARTLEAVRRVLCRRYPGLCLPPAAAAVAGAATAATPQDTLSVAPEACPHCGGQAGQAPIEALLAEVRAEMARV